MAKLYKGKIPCIFNDLNEGWVRGEPTGKEATGAIPRDFNEDPVAMGDSPAGMKLYDESEDAAIFDAGEKNEDTLEHMYLKAAQAGEFVFLDQNGFPDCWCHSTGHAKMLDQLKQNMKVQRINAVAMATMMNATNGGWCGKSMKFGREKGFPLVGTGPGEWPYQSRHGQVTPELLANMAKHKALEDWYDLAKAEYDQELTKRQFITCLHNNLPTPSDYNKYSHSMCSLRYVRTDYGWGPLTLNSWKDFGYYGLCVLINHVPDGSCALRSSTPVAA